MLQLENEYIISKKSGWFGSMNGVILFILFPFKIPHPLSTCITVCNKDTFVPTQ